MKKFLMVAAGAAALTATPAMATDTVSITPTATVAPTCTLQAGVRNSPSLGSATNFIGYDPATQTTTTTTAVSEVDLSVAGPRLLTSLTIRCNTINATATFSTTNDFKLKNGASEIPYSLSFNNQTFQTTTTTGTLSSTGGPGGSGFGRSLNFILASAINPINVAPGTYDDTITVTVAPSV